MDYNYQGKANSGGIYCIRNKINGRLYIGSTVRFKQRAREHQLALEENRHHCKFLQNDFAKCGTEQFVFEPLEVLEEGNFPSREDWKHALIVQEQHSIDEMTKLQTLYNGRKTAIFLGERTWDDDRRTKMSEIMTKKYEANPELVKASSKRAKEVRWKDHSANITVTNQETQESVLITGSLREWCLGRNLSYKAFHQLVKGKIKSSGGWFLGTEAPLYVDRKGEKRVPLSQEHRAKIAGGKFQGIQLINPDGRCITLGFNIKEQAKELDLHYTTLLKVIKGTCKSVSGWEVSNLSFQVLSARPRG